MPPDVNSERPRKRQPTEAAFLPPENLVFTAGKTWAAKVKPPNPRDDVSLKIAAATKEFEKIKLVRSGSLIGIPMITIADDLLQQINDEWEEAIIIKLAGRPWNVELLRTRFESLWDLRGHYELFDVGTNLFILRELDSEKREMVLTKGPWKIAGQFMSIRKWYPEFDPRTYKVETTITWVRIQYLPPQFYRKAMLVQIARALGEPIMTDASTFYTERGRYARLCVQVDLSRPLERGIQINGIRYPVIYENLQALCFSCGRADHTVVSCLLTNKPESTPPMEDEFSSKTQSPSQTDKRDDNDSYGPWLLMTRNNRKKVSSSQGGTRSNDGTRTHGKNTKKNQTHERAPLRESQAHNHRPTLQVMKKSALQEGRPFMTCNRFATLENADKENIPATKTPMQEHTTGARVGLEMTHGDSGQGTGHETVTLLRQRGTMVSADSRQEDIPVSSNIMQEDVSMCLDPNKHMDQDQNILGAMRERARLRFGKGWIGLLSIWIGENCSRLL